MSHDQALVKSSVTAWNNYVTQVDKMFAGLTDEQLLIEIAPGKNRMIYLLGHLTAVHDRMLPLLYAGERLHPELDARFLTASDKDAAEMPSPASLRKSWAEVNAALEKGLAGLSAEDWVNRHASVSEEDFVKEPHRNRFSVFLSRLNHLAYHYGQLTLAVKA